MSKFNLVFFKFGVFLYFDLGVQFGVISALIIVIEELS